MPFLTKAVFEARRTAMRRMMDRLDLAAIAFESRYFFQYATNFSLDVEPWERPVFVIVPYQGEPFAVLNMLSANHFRFMQEKGVVWLSDVSLYTEFPRDRTQGFSLDRWPQLTAELLRGRFLEKARIGVEDQNSALGKVQELLPKLTLIPIENEMRRLRWVKHPEEVELARKASALSDWAQERYRENVRPGRLTQELDASMSALIYEEAAARFAGECLEITCMMTLSGRASSAGHGDGAPTGSRIGIGDVIVNIVELRLNGILIENERTWFCGKPSPEKVRLFNSANAAQQAAIEQVVTGKPASAIDAASRAVFERDGLDHLITHRTGHGMGLTSHEYPEDMPYNERPLLENEIYSVEPGIYHFDVGGFRMDDTVVVASTPLVLTHYPKDIKNQTID